MKTNYHNRTHFLKIFCPLQQLLFLFIIVHFTVAQETSKTDSTEITKLNEVVVTGENKVMALSKKLFKVGVLQTKDIENSAANNLADLLNNNLNISIIPDASTGRSTISMFGLDGQYVKILIDGIPLVSDNGIGNNIDITQLNLENIERIEIVEGSMGVLYGDNAVAGVINIVSKKGLQHTWEFQLSVQEETIGKEYSLFSEGRHIQNLNIGHKIGENASLKGGVSKNDFNGFLNTYKGPNYSSISNDGTVVNDGLRGTEWNPKTQQTIFANLNATIKKHQLFYNFQSYDENITIYDHIVNGRIDSSTGETNPTATDEEFTTKRILNSLTLSGTIFKSSSYNLALSYQNQKRYYKEYVYDIKQQGISSIILDDLSQSSEIWYSKAFINNLIPKNENLNLQLGYEFNNQTGFDAIASGNYSQDVVKNKLENYDFFAVVDVNPVKKLGIHPGVRFTNNSQFGNKLIWSLSTNYAFSPTLKAKGVLGSAFRAPNFEELFYFFVDSNHNVQGNPNLKPEDGISIFTNLGKVIKIKDNGLYKTSLSYFHFNIQDKIEFANTGDDDGLFTYLNIDEAKTHGVSWENDVKYKQLNFRIGATYLGQSTSIETNYTKDFLWTVNLQSSLGIYIPSIKTNCSLQLNYNGASQRYSLNTDDEILLQETEAFTWINSSFKSDIMPNFTITAGARNLLNIISINTSNIASTNAIHGGNTNTTQLIGNGRSFYLKLLYTINLN